MDDSNIAQILFGLSDQQTYSFLIEFDSQITSYGYHIVYNRLLRRKRGLILLVNQLIILWTTSGNFGVCILCVDWFTTGTKSLT